MRILLDPGTYRLDNAGDAAMLLASVDRFRRFRPDAELLAFTGDPERLTALAASVTPIDGSVRYVATRLPRLRGTRRSWFTSLWRSALFRFPDLVTRLPGAVDDETGLQWGDLEKLLTSCDAFVVAGAGQLNAEFERHALGTLLTLRLAQRLGLPTAMLGQGIGPLTPSLRKAARQTLARADIVAVREALHAPRLLAQLGIGADRLRITGDDALGLALRGGGLHEVGSAVGLCVRVAPYSGLGHDDAKQLASAVRTALGARSLLRLPISTGVRETSDERWMESLGLGEPIVEDHSAPLVSLFAAIDRCRLVVTGSYHLAVFAAARGIPSVVLVRSDYYALKFEGLAHQFGGDFVRVVDLRFGSPYQWPDILAREIAMADRLPLERREKAIGRARDSVLEADASVRALSLKLGSRVGSRSIGCETASDHGASVDFSVVLPARDAGATIAVQLKALTKLEIPGTGSWEIVVVDNGSRDRTAAIAASFEPQLPVRVVSAPGFRGVSYARNIGIAAARGRRVLICDADDVVHPRWAVEMLRGLDRADAVAGRIVTGDETPDTAPVMNRPALAFLPYAHGGNCGLQRSLVDAIGGFDESYVRGGDDKEFFWRAQLNGMRLGYAPGALVRVTPRPTLRARCLQYYRFGRSHPRLYRDFRQHGMPRRATRTVLADVRRTVRNAIAQRDPEVRATALAHLARLAGRAVGSAKTGVAYL